MAGGSFGFLAWQTLLTLEGQEGAQYGWAMGGGLTMVGLLILAVQNEDGHDYPWERPARKVVGAVAAAVAIGLAADVLCLGLLPALLPLVLASALSTLTFLLCAGIMLELSDAAVPTDRSSATELFQTVDFQCGAALTGAALIGLVWASPGGPVVSSTLALTVGQTYCLTLMMQTDPSAAPQPEQLQAAEQQLEVQLQQQLEVGT